MLARACGGELVVETEKGKETVTISHHPNYFDPHHKHSTNSWSNGHRMVLVAFSVRDSGRLSRDHVATLRHHGFDWEPHYRPVEDSVESDLKAAKVRFSGVSPTRDLPQASKRDLPQASKRDLPQASERDLPQASEHDLPQASERDLPQASERELPQDSERDLPQAPFAKGELEGLHVGHDLELAIQDMEDRASRLRDLIEQEEIMSEEYRRMSEESREHLLSARDQVAQFLDEVQASLIELERLRDGTCLKAMSQSPPPMVVAEEVNYEDMLDSLEEDLKIVHTVPLAQVKDVLSRWKEAIHKEVAMLFQTGILRRVSQREIKELESSGKVVMAPAKCVFTLKPPSTPGNRVRRKCRM